MDFDVSKYQSEGVQFVVGRLKGETSTTVQSVLFDSSTWTEDRARTWLADHEFKSAKADTTENRLRFRQREPSEFEDDSLRTISAGRRDLGMDLNGVEVMRVGEWNGDDFSKADLDDMVAAFDRAGFKPPVKLGHAEASGDRAFGWVRSLRRIGEVLVADLADIPEQVFNVIREHGFDSVSAEVFFNLKRSGQTFRRALKAIALLGAEIPAVSGLKPLRDSLELTDAKFDSVHAYTHVNVFGSGLAAMLNRRIDAMNEPRSEIIERLASAAGISASTVNQILQGDIIRPPDGRLEAFGRVLNINAGSLKRQADTDDESQRQPNFPSNKNAMDRKRKKDMTVAELTEAVAKLTKDIEALGEAKGDDAAKKAKLESDKKDAEIALLTAKLAETDKDKGKPVIDPVQVKQMQDTIADLTKRTAEAEERERAATIQAKVDKIDVPAFRDHFAAIYDMAGRFEGKVKFFVLDKDGHKKAADSDPLAVVDDLAKRFNDHVAVLLSEVSVASDLHRQEAPTDSEQAEVELDRLAKAYAAKNKVDYAAAIEAVMSDPAHKALARHVNSV